MFRVIELGCGCGAAILGFALTQPRAICLGLEKEWELIDAAQLNAVQLGLNARVEFLPIDLENNPHQSLPESWRGQCALVQANPPWTIVGEGKLPRNSLRQHALCASPDLLTKFCKAANVALCHHGFFCCILPPRRLPDFMGAIDAAGLGLRTILPVASFDGRHAKRLLLLCQKDAANDLHLKYPLVLYQLNNQKQVVPTNMAIKFCPWLAARGERGR